jgi:hypothetical protein
MEESLCIQNCKISFFSRNIPGSRKKKLKIIEAFHNDDGLVLWDVDALCTGHIQIQVHEETPSTTQDENQIEYETPNESILRNEENVEISGDCDPPGGYFDLENEFDTHPACDDSETHEICEAAGII